MSDTTPAPDAPKPTPPAQEVDGEQTPLVEIDWKQKAREWEKRAKENKTAADELAAIRESQKSEAEKAAERLATAEKDAADARREALRFRVAAKFQIDDEDADLFLTGSDEETLTRQAQRLAGRASDEKKRGVVPREGKSPTPAGADPMREFAKDLFDRAVTEN